MLELTATTGPHRDGPGSAGSAGGARVDLDRLEADLVDVETALACQQRDEPGRCDTCTRADADGSLSARPALAACAEGRQPVASGACG